MRLPPRDEVAPRRIGADFLGCDQTLKIMKTGYLYPDLADRRSVGGWEESGGQTIYERAHQRVEELLSTHYPKYIDLQADARIRERFPVELRPERMKPGAR